MLIACPAATKLRRLLSVLCLVAAASLGSSSLASAQTVVDPTLEVEVIGTGAFLPTTMAFVAPNDLLVVELFSGSVLRILDGVQLPDPVLTLPVFVGGDRGLLGIVANTEDPPAVFLYYTADSVTNRVVRYDWNAASGLLENPQPLLELPADSTHNAGPMVFGPPGEAPGVGDGALLYGVIGDLGRAGQLQNVPLGPPPDDTGVIYRIRQDGQPAEGNPFGEPGLERYFAYGIRNSFGLAIDRKTGFLWDTENGPHHYDEVNLVMPGMNSGWERIMGPDARDPDGVADLFHLPGSAYSDPEFSWLTTVAPTAIIFPFRTSLGPSYDDVALVADSKNGLVYRLPLNPDRTGFDLSAMPLLADLVADDAEELLPILWADLGQSCTTDLEFGPDGDLYALCLDGKIVRVSGPWVSVEIDVMPHSEENRVDPLRKVPLPVAILGADGFDVANIDRTTLAFGPAGAEPFGRRGGFVWDVNHDERPDLLSLYRMQESGIAIGQTEACVQGLTSAGVPFYGCDVIDTRPRCGKGFALALTLPPFVWLRKRRHRGRAQPLEGIDS